MRPLSPEEQALWQRVVESVRPLHGPHAKARSRHPPSAAEGAAARPASPAPPRKAEPGTTLDGSWDKRLSRGLVQPDRIVDLHGHSLATAYDLLDRRLEQAAATGDRVLLLITGKAARAAPSGAARSARRSATGSPPRATPASIAAVRGAHPRHGGSGALYIVLRRKR